MLVGAGVVNDGTTEIFGWEGGGAGVVVVNVGVPAGAGVAGAGLENVVGKLNIFSPVQLLKFQATFYREFSCDRGPGSLSLLGGCCGSVFIFALQEARSSLW